MRFRWLLLLPSLLSVFLLSATAQAGQLRFWRFDSNQNRLVFTTEGGVQPKAQLIANPTRVVIDLPGITLKNRTANQRMRGGFKEIRVGQVDDQTTRIVIELAPGYTLDPQQVKFRGANPSQWSVDLPAPERIGSSLSLPPQSSLLLPPASLPPTNQPSQPLPALLVGQSNQSYQPLPPLLGGQNSQPYQPLPPLLGGQNNQPYQPLPPLLGGQNNQPYQPLPPLLAGPPRPAPASSVGQLATVQSVEITNNGTQLLIRADQRVRATSTWDAKANAYQITIPDARLANQVRGPQLDASSPISRVLLRQQDPRTVVILVQPSTGTQIGELNQLNDQLLALQLQQTRSTQSPLSSIPVPPPDRTSPVLPPAPYSPPTSLPRVPNGRIIVVVDPGHGGPDPGAIGIGGLQEKDIVMAIAEQVASLLDQQGVQAVLTRTGDYDLDLEPRVALAERMNANVFVSIHANSINLSRTDISGLETYYYSSASGQRLAQTIHSNILQSTNIQDRGVRTARFYVLRHTSMPSTLVEVGFVTGREDAAKLSDPAYRTQMAQANRSWYPPIPPTNQLNLKSQQSVSNPASYSSDFHRHPSESDLYTGLFSVEPSFTLREEPQQKRIGVFDSGIGGLTVLRELYRQLPNESILYFADTARLPYGTRSASEIIQFGFEILTWMRQQDVKMVVMACNTSDALALDTLIPEFNLPILRLILSGARAAVQQGRRIGVIATPATAASNAYRRAMLEIEATAQVWQVGCPEFVPLVEQNRLYEPYTAEVAEQYLEPLLQQRIDTLVYGCTHYPHLAPIIREILPSQVKLIDPAEHVVTAAAQELDLLGLKNNRAPLPTRFCVSGCPQQFAKLSVQWLGCTPAVEQLHLPTMSHSPRSLEPVD